MVSVIVVKLLKLLICKEKDRKIERKNGLKC